MMMNFAMVNMIMSRLPRRGTVAVGSKNQWQKLRHTLLAAGAPVHASSSMSTVRGSRRQVDRQIDIDMGWQEKAAETEIDTSKMFWVRLGC